jgi:hypothetical protein
VVGRATEQGRQRAAARGIEVLELAAVAGLDAAEQRPAELVTEVLRDLMAR